MVVIVVSNGSLVGILPGCQAEKITTKFGYNCVRYGNVNNSRGSVIPYWKRLAEEGKPLPITNRDMTRFMIDIPRAIWIIEKALKEMKGEIYVPRLKAVDLIRIANKISTKQVDVGERAGEKLHEVLINEEESRGRVRVYRDYYVIQKEQNQTHFGWEYSSENAPRISDKELEEIISKF